MSIAITEEKEDCNSHLESIKPTNNVLSFAPVDSYLESRSPNFDRHSQNASKTNKSVSPSLEIIETTSKLEIDVNPVPNQSLNKEVPGRRFSTMTCNNSSQVLAVCVFTLNMVI